MLSSILRNVNAIFAKKVHFCPLINNHSKAVNGKSSGPQAAFSAHKRKKAALRLLLIRKPEPTAVTP